ncbi:hypothetical protein CCP3SC1_90042 [Gammaproteobacteria bacterium]
MLGGNLGYRTKLDTVAEVKRTARNWVIVIVYGVNGDIKDVLTPEGNAILSANGRNSAGW